MLISRTWSRSCQSPDPVLTCHLQSRVPAVHLASRIARDAPVHTVILLLLAVHRPEEEQRTGHQQDVICVQLHLLAVLVPLDRGRWFALGFAVQRHRIVLWHDGITRIFDDPWRPVLS